MGLKRFVSSKIQKYKKWVLKEFAESETKRNKLN